MDHTSTGNHGDIVRFFETPLKGAFVIDIDPISDERGYFARTFCKKEFELYRLKNDFKQCNISFNLRRGTIRGMHFQIPPYEETKLVSCINGAIYDVIIDLRQDSDTYLQWYSVELNAENQRMLYVPEGFAHGFQTLEDNTKVFYQMGEYFEQQSSSGVRWDDPVFGIEWPLPCEVISNKDQQFPGYKL